MRANSHGDRWAVGNGGTQGTGKNSSAGAPTMQLDAFTSTWTSYRGAGLSIEDRGD